MTKPANPTPEQVLDPSPSEIFIPDPGVTVKVFPLSVNHLSKYSQQIGTAIGVLSNIGLSKGTDIKLQLIVKMVPYIVLNMLPLIRECVTVVKPKGYHDELPHWAWPPIVKKWIEYNFGTEDKWGPWVAVAESLVKAATEKDPQILATLSKFLSQPDTTSGTSSTADAPAGPTPDGPSPSSSSGPNEPPAPSPAPTTAP